MASENIPTFVTGGGGSQAPMMGSGANLPMMQRNPLSGVASALKTQAGAKSFLAKEAEEEALRDDRIWGIELSAEYVTRWNNQLEQWSGHPEEVSEESIKEFDESTWEELSGDQSLTPRQELIKREIKARNFSNLNGKARGIQTAHKTQKRVKQFSNNFMGFALQMEQAMQDPANPLAPADAVDLIKAFFEEAAPTFLADLDISEDGKIPSTTASGNQLLDSLLDGFIRASIINENLTPDQRTDAIMKSSNPDLLFEEMKRAHPKLFSASFYNGENLAIFDSFMNDNGKMNAESWKWFQTVQENGGFGSLRGTVSASDNSLMERDNFVATALPAGVLRAEIARDDINKAQHTLPDGTTMQMTLSSLTSAAEATALHFGDKKVVQANKDGLKAYGEDPVAFWQVRDKAIRQLVDTQGALMDPDSPFYNPKDAPLLNMQVAAAVYEKNSQFNPNAPIVQAWDKPELEAISALFKKNVISLRRNESTGQFLNLGESAEEIKAFFKNTRYDSNEELYQSLVDQMDDKDDSAFMKTIYSIAPRADAYPDDTEIKIIETELLMRHGDLSDDHNALAEDLASDFVDDVGSELHAMYSFGSNPDAATHIANAIVREVMEGSGFASLDDDASRPDKLKRVRDYAGGTRIMKSLLKNYNGHILQDNGGMVADPNREGKLRLTSSGKLVPQATSSHTADQKQRLIHEKLPTYAVEEYKNTIGAYGGAKALIAENFWFNQFPPEGKDSYLYSREELESIKSATRIDSDTGKYTVSPDEALRSFWVNKAEKATVTPVAEGLLIGSANEHGEPVEWVRASSKNSNGAGVVTSWGEMDLVDSLVVNKPSNDFVPDLNQGYRVRRDSASSRSRMVDKFDELVALRQTDQTFEMHIDPITTKGLDWFHFGGDMENKLLVDQKLVSKNILEESFGLNFDSGKRRSTPSVTEARMDSASDNITKLFKGGNIQVLNPGARQLALSSMSDAAIHIKEKGFMVAKLDGSGGSTAYGYAIDAKNDEPAAGRNSFPFKSTGGEFPEESYIAQEEAKYIAKAKSTGETFYAWRGFTPETSDYWAVFMTTDEKGNMTPDIFVVSDETDEPFESRHFKNFPAYFSNLTNLPL
jgi:hypothetical protein